MSEGASAKRQSAFQEQVYEIVQSIPPGRVMTYGGIAALIPPPADMPLPSYRRVRARWAGYAMRKCPEELPWHRVVNAEGKISPRLGHGPHVQRLMLQEEEVVFDNQGCIDLEACRWFPATDWLIARGFLPPAKGKAGP
jgi:methylated-DNA-protein-cysteine methyltransferase-like protein